MTIPFFPRMGHVLMGDFSDLHEPEMTKIRPVIVVSPRLPYRSNIVAIVAISLTEPKHQLPFCYRLSKNYHPNEADDLPCWAKADMITNIALRLQNWTSKVALSRVNSRRFSRGSARNLVWPRPGPD